MAFFSNRKKRQQAAAEAAARQAAEAEQEAAKQRILDEAERERADRDRLLDAPTQLNSRVNVLTVGQRYGYRPRLVLADRQPANRGRW